MRMLPRRRRRPVLTQLLAASTITIDVAGCIRQIGYVTVAIILALHVRDLPLQTIFEARCGITKLVSQ